jgi:hypothetical protein
MVKSVARDFRWNDWNLGKMQKHGVNPLEAEDAIYIGHAMPLTTLRRRG